MLRHRFCNAPIILISNEEALMERKKASDFDPQLFSLFNRYVHGAHQPARVFGRRRQIRRRRHDGDGFMGDAAAQLRLGAASRQRRQAHQDGIRFLFVTEGQRLGWQDARTARAAGQRRQISGCRGDSRKPRTQSVYRRCRAALGRRRLHGLRTGCDYGRWADIRPWTSTADRSR